MRRFSTESILKGIFLGLLCFVAVQESDWTGFAIAGGLGLGGLATAISVAAWRRLKEGYRVKGGILPFILFATLEGSELVYTGVLVGLAAAAIYLHQVNSWYLVAAAIGGAGIGIQGGFLRQVKDPRMRVGLSLAGAGVLTSIVLLWLGVFGDFGERIGLISPLRSNTVFAAQILLGIPLYFFLTIAGRDEESEADVAAMCALLALGIAPLTDKAGYQTTGFVAALMVYFWYVFQIVPRVRVYKDVLRGYCFESMARHRQAILSFQRALERDPGNMMAREGIWSVHRSLDPNKLAGDTETLSALDVDMCLERVGALLLDAGPSPARLEESRRLLELVLNQRPAMRAIVHYWRAVANTHERRFDDASSELEQVLDPSTYVPNDVCRKAILLPAWQLALKLHPELARRVGTPQLAMPGRRMEAIAAVERHLKDHAEDADVWGFKRVLYQDLQEADYDAAAVSGAGGEFDHGYAHQLGLALVNEAERWQRGCEFLRIAARGLPAHGPSILCQIAQAYQKHGDGEKAWNYYELAKKAGRAAGPKNLPDEERQIYYSALKLLGDGAMAHNRLDLAIENYQLYAEYERAGLETLRTLADLHERQGDPLAALRVTEQALLYNAKDKDFLARKDRYYYSVLPDHLKARLDSIRIGFDVDYCLRKARALLDAKSWDLETLDWAQHLAELALVVQPVSLPAKVLLARARLRRGEKEEAVATLEEMHKNKPESFATGEDEEAWYHACKLLGELYLNDLGRPDAALECFKTFRQSSKSGADTLFKIGQAYEQLGDCARAAKFYKHVIAFEGHPLAPDAHDALQRLGAN